DIRYGADKSFSNPGSVAKVSLQGDSFLLRYRAEQMEGTYTTGVRYPLRSLKSLYFMQDVEVEGTLTGELSIGCRGSITITDDLLYTGSNKKTGRPAEDSEALLGLIAEKNVFINKPAAKAQREGGVRVNASIVAMDSSMGTKNLYNMNMGTFHLWGSITERVRGVNAVSREEQIVFGYQKSGHYDQRLRKQT
ncbi:MAG: hypothetical protein GY953_29280, partial [bacterium]|nr:hypothetical protein [bacterium]